MQAILSPALVAFRLLGVSSLDSGRATSRPTFVLIVGISRSDRQA